MNTFALRGGFRLPSTLFLGVLALAGTGLPVGYGASATWQGADGNFTTGNNWNTSSAPGNSTGNNLDTATFLTTGQTAINFSGSNYYLGSILFGSGGTGASAYTFGSTSPGFELALSASGSPAYPNGSGPGGTILVNGNVTQAQTFNVKLALTPGAYTFTNNATAAGATLNFNRQIRSTNTGNRTSTLILGGSNTSANTISGPIVNGSGAGMILNKTDAGRWVLTGANTYTGGTTINGGTLQIGNGGTVGSIVGNVAVTAADTSFLSFNRSDAVTFAGAITGAGDVFQAGPGTLTLNNLNTTGRLYLSAGSVVSAGANNAVNYLRAVDGGTVNLTVNPNTTLTLHGSANGPSTLRVLNGTTLNVAGNVNAEGGPLSVGLGGSGNGTLNLTGGTLDADRVASGNYAFLDIGDGSGATGTVTQSGNSIVRTGGAYILGTDGGVGVHNVTGNAELRTGNVWTTGFHLYLGLNDTPGQIGTSGTLTISDYGKLTLGPASFLDVGTNLGADSGGAGTITQNGAGSVVTFGGDFAAFGSQGAGGTGTYNLQAGTLNLNTGTVSFGDAAGATGILNQRGGTLTATTGVTIGNAGTGTYNLSAGTATFNNGLTTGAQAGGTGTVNQSGGTLTVIPGATLAFGAGNGTYNLAGGTLQVGGVNGIQGGGGTANFNLGGGTLKVISADLSTSVPASLVTGTFSVVNTNGLNATFSGAISGAGNVVKAGLGTLTFTANNPFGGSATIRAGTLEAAGPGALGAVGAIVVNHGGTLLFSGAGNVNRVNNSAPVSLNGGTVAIAAVTGGVREGTGMSNQNGAMTGANTPGLGSLTLAANSFLDFSGAAGTLTFASFSPGFYTLTILNYASTASISAGGVFSGTDGTDSRLIFATDQANNLGAFSFGGIGAQEINLGGGYFEVIPVPEPGSVLAGLFAAGALGWHGLRRHGRTVVRRRRPANPGVAATV